MKPDIKKKRKPWPAWVVWPLVIVVVSSIYWGPLAVQAVRTPKISENFALEDAVAALRLSADDKDYLVLVDPDGDTRSVRLDERGFDHSTLLWTEDGLVTEGPRDDYVIGEDGTSRHEIPLAGRWMERGTKFSQRQRLETPEGYFSWLGSANGDEAVFWDAATDKLTALDGWSTSALFAACDDGVIAIDDSGVVPVTEETFERLEAGDRMGYGRSQGLYGLVCDGDLVYGLGEVSELSPMRQQVQVWNRATEETATGMMHYPDPMAITGPNTPAVVDGRLFWASDYGLWSVQPPIPSASGEQANGDEGVRTLEPVETFRFSAYRHDGHSPVVYTSEGLLDWASGRAFGVTVDEDWIERSKGHSYDKLNAFSIFSIDPRTGKGRTEILSHEIDFPKRDFRVKAVAVNPEWAAGLPSSPSTPAEAEADADDDAD